MKIMKKILMVLAAVFIMMQTVTYPVQAMEAFEIKEYHVQLDVTEEGVITVTETMFVEFSYRRHGIYVNIPTNYSMNWGNEGTQRYIFPITDARVLSNHDYEVDRQSEGVQIKIGSSDYYASPTETYRWQYQVHTTDLNLDGLQMLYYNLISRWDTTINGFSFEINMPKSFDSNLIEFYIGDDLDNVNALDWSCVGNTITGQYRATLQPNESFTVMLPLELGYFVYPDYSAVPWIVVGGSWIVVILIFLVFLRVGKDEPLIIPVEFSAPEGISSAEVGYIIDGSVDDRDVVSLILDWGRKGYLSINDEEGELIFKKLRESDESLTHYERRLFNALFQSSEMVSTKSLREKFYTSIGQCKQDLSRYMNAKERRIFSRQSIAFRVLTYVLSCFPTVVLITLVTWFSRYSMIGLAISLLPLLPLITAIVLLSMLESQRYSLSGAVKMLYLVFSVVTLLIYAGIMLVWAVMMQVTLIVVIALILATILLCLLGQRMIKRTERGQKLYGEVIGLRQFILVAEKERLAMLAEDNPYLFYDILPYAYAFNLTEVWSDHFKDLLIPEVNWYTSSDPHMHGYMMGYALSRNMAAAQAIMISVPRVEAGKGGGGFGSGGFGGGGFSGGGFGGSSGGSW